MYKLALLLLVATVLAVASAQYLHNPYTTAGVYRSGVYGGYYNPTAYGAYAGVPAVRNYGYGLRYY